MAALDYQTWLATNGSLYPQNAQGYQAYLAGLGGPGNTPAAAGITITPFTNNQQPASLPPAIDPGITHSGTGNASTSPFSPIIYSPGAGGDTSGGGGGGGINPLYLIIGVIAIIGIAAYFMVKK